MSKRNNRNEKARRRQERTARDASRPDPAELVQVQSYDELVGQAERGEMLPCGCDAHQLLHSGGWHTFDELDD